MYHQPTRADGRPVAEIDPGGRLNGTHMGSPPAPPNGASHRLPSVSKGPVAGASGWVSSGRSTARVASVSRVREVADPKRRCAGSSRPRWIEVTPRGALPDPRLQLWVRRLGASAISWSIEGVGDTSLEAAHRLERLFPSSELAPVVGPARGVQADLTGGGDVDHVVGLAVPSSGQPVPDHLPGGRLDRSGTGPGREPVPVGEPGHVPDVGQDPGGHGSDPGQGPSGSPTYEEEGLQFPESGLCRLEVVTIRRAVDSATNVDEPRDVPVEAGRVG